MCRIDPDADGHSKADSGSQSWEVTNVWTSPLMDQVKDTNIVFGECEIPLDSAQQLCSALWPCPAD